MATTWTIAIDWERNGNFTGTYDDVTQYVIEANWFLGMRHPYQSTADDAKLTEGRSADHPYGFIITLSPLIKWR